MNRNVVVVGGGRVGRHVAEELHGDQFSVTVLEQDPEKCKQVARFATRVVEGDGADPAVIAQADPGDAAVVAALTNDTAVNLEVCEHVHDIDPAVKTILRIAHDGEQANGHRRFVDDVVYPAAAGAEAALDRIARI